MKIRNKEKTRSGVLPEFGETKEVEDPMSKNFFSLLTRVHTKTGAHEQNMNCCGEKQKTKGHISWLSSVTSPK
jgi:hypothetical protein